MTAMTTTAGRPYGRPLVRDDLDALPDDGPRYDLLDGTLLASPAPRRLHQRLAADPHVLLHGGCPPAVDAPSDVVLADDTVLQPDLPVGPREQSTDRDVLGTALPFPVRLVPAELVP